MLLFKGYLFQREQPPSSPNKSKTRMSIHTDDDDLDAQLAIFEREIEQVSAATAAVAAKAASATETTNSADAAVISKNTDNTRINSKLASNSPTALQASTSSIPETKQANPLTKSSTLATQTPYYHHHPQQHVQIQPQAWHYPPQQTLPAHAAYHVPSNPSIPPTSVMNTVVQPQPEPQQQSTPPKKKPNATIKRTAAGQVWHDESLEDWPADDHRLFVGDLGPDATDDELTNGFSKYASFNMARVVRDKRTSNCRGYGFVSFGKASDMLAAIKEMNGKYVGSRPVKLRRSTWKKRSLSKDKWKQVHAFRAISKR